MTTETKIENTNLIEVRNLKVHFPMVSGFLRKQIGVVKAVDDVSFHIKEGETLSLVGESGCGKTTTGRALLGAVTPTAGSVKFRRSNGDVIETAGNQNENLELLRQDIQIIFQDPFASLNPRMTVFDVIADPLKANNIASGSELEDRVTEMLKLVGLAPEMMRRYPHAFSGGQRQRIGIARALVMNPRLLIADEPVSALDVSVQSQILNLMQDLQERLNLAYLFISHDLSVVQYISHKVAVMYVGKIVESGTTQEVFTTPKHPYTQALLASVPIPDPDVESGSVELEGEIADPANPPSGCYFHPRCHHFQDICSTTAPDFSEDGEKHIARCHFSGDLNLPGVQD